MADRFDLQAPQSVITAASTQDGVVVFVGVCFTLEQAEQFFRDAIDRTAIALCVDVPSSAYVNNAREAGVFFRACRG